MDCDQFAEDVTKKLKACPEIEFIDQDITAIPSEGYVSIATGPLTSDALYQYIQTITGEEQLNFFDAIAPVVDADSIIWT